MELESGLGRLEDYNSLTFMQAMLVVIIVCGNNEDILDKDSSYITDMFSCSMDRLGTFKMVLEEYSEFIDFIEGYFRGREDIRCRDVYNMAVIEMMGMLGTTDYKVAFREVLKRDGIPVMWKLDDVHIDESGVFRCVTGYLSFLDRVILEWCSSFIRIEYEYRTN